MQMQNKTNYVRHFFKLVTENMVIYEQNRKTGTIRKINENSMFYFYNPFKYKLKYYYNTPIILVARYNDRYAKYRVTNCEKCFLYYDNYSQLEKCIIDNYKLGCVTDIKHNDTKMLQEEYTNYGVEIIYVEKANIKLV